MSDEPHIAYLNMGQWPLFLGFATDRKAFAKEMKRLKIPKEDSDFFCSPGANATTHFLTSRQGGRTTIITIEPPGETPFQVYAALIAHEAVHAAQRLWIDIGEQEPGDEAEAYLVQSIVQFCLSEAYETHTERTVVPQ